MRAGSCPRLLTIDVGNSRAKFGLFAPGPSAAPGASPRLPTCLEVLSVAHADPLPWPQLAAWHADAPLDRAIIAGVNPPGVERILQAWPAEWRLPVQVVRDPAALPLAVTVEAPAKVGIDRLLNAVAANALRQPGEPLIIVDSGTATTVDLLTADGAFAGGAILPGFELCALALHRYTALLPLVEAAELSGTPPAALGRQTRDAIRSGLFWGQLGATRELIAQLAAVAAAADACPPPRVVLTGGGGGLLAPHLPGALHESNLPLKGLALLAEQGLP